MELSSLCENSMNGRLRMYENEEYFELLLNCILADFCEFINDLYDHIMRFQNARYNLIIKYRHLVPQQKQVFAHYRALLYDAESLVLHIVMLHLCYICCQFTSCLDSVVCSLFVHSIGILGCQILSRR